MFRAAAAGVDVVGAPRDLVSVDQIVQGLGAETLSVSARNHRRDALTNLVKVLYRRRAAAELVDLVRFKRLAPRPRWLDRAHIADVLSQLTPGSKTVVRLRLMHWTGMRPSRRGFAGRARMWPTSRICTGTRIRRRR